MMNFNLFKISFIALLCLVILQVKTCYAQTDMQVGIEHYYTANFDKAKECFERVIKNDKKNRLKAYVYLALIESAYNNTSQVDKYLNDLLSLNPSFNIADIEDATPIKDQFYILKQTNTEDQRIKKEQKRIAQLEEEIRKLKKQIPKKNNVLEMKEKLYVKQRQQLGEIESVQYLWKKIGQYHGRYSSLLHNKNKGYKVSDKEIIAALNKIIEYTQNLIEHYEQSSQKDELTIKRLKIFLYIKQKAYIY